MMKISTDSNADSIDIEFDKMMGLYKTDPEAFEEVRKRLIEDTINKVQDPKRRQRMRGYQFRIDNQLNKFKNPLMRFEEMRRLLQLGVFKFKKVLTNPYDFMQDKSKIATVTNINKKK